MIPAVIKKASSLELLQTYEPPCATVVSKKRISAPLAKQESITDSEVMSLCSLCAHCVTPLHVSLQSLCSLCDYSICLSAVSVLTV